LAKTFEKTSFDYANCITIMQVCKNNGSSKVTENSFEEY